MRKERLAVFCLLCILIAAACGHNDDPLTLGASDFLIVQKPIESFIGAGSIEKIIVPEITENSLIAEVDQIAFGKNDEIYLADLFSQKAVFRFNRFGRFISKYGRIGQGPGEYNSLTAFDIDAEGRVFLLTDTKLIVYNKNGEFEKETKIYELGGDIKSIGDEIFVRIYDTHRDPAKRDFIFRVYDSNLEFRRGILRNDPRLKTYRFLPRHSTALFGKKIVFADVYDLAINIYDPKSKVCQRIAFPSENDRIASVWSKKRFGEDDRSMVRDNIHRFNAIYSFRETLYLTEIIRRNKEVNFWLLDLGQKRIDVYPLLDLIGNTTKSSRSIRFDYIIGAYDNGLIFIVDDENKFEIIKKHYPQFDGIQFSINDNPMIIYFRLNEKP
jgi:hypothetical protein